VEYAGGSEIGLEMFKNQEKRREQEIHNVGQVPKIMIFPVPGAFPRVVMTLANR
jgi:hypothetical protein